MAHVAVVVTGDRHADYGTWRDVVHKALTQDELKGVYGVLIHGDARGIDRIAAKIAGMHGWQVIPMPAQWGRDGNGAGPKRNQAMLEMILLLKDQGYIVAGLAFHDDLAGSKGTNDMVRRARANGVDVCLHTTTAAPEWLA